MFGAIELEKFDGITKMPQDYASAWTAVEGLVGASYKPLLCLGKQVVKGVDYFFIAEQTFTTFPVRRRVIKLTIHGFNGEYELIGESIEEIL